MSGNRQTLLDAEERLIDWQYQRGGGFYGALMLAISLSDVSNRRKLAQVFPADVFVVDSFQRVDGYWEELLERKGILL